VTTTLLTSQTSAGEATADAIIIGVLPGTGGPALAPGAEDVDAALDGSLAATLAALGATGKAEEITKIATAGRLAAPLIVAVGLGAPNSALNGASGGAAPFDGEALRRAAGAAVRSLGPAHRQVALALPARDDAEAGAVALGALLGGYEFTRYRAATTGAGSSPCWPTAPRAARRWTGPGPG
jgi:leucyl aminopeptidase